MKEENMTALISCYARAYHTKNYKFRIYNDPLAFKILGSSDYHKISEQMKKGILFFNPTFSGTDDEALRYIVDNQLAPSVIGRSIFAEKKLENSKRFGTKQYLILASGYDTSFYKNKDLKVFEVDTQQMIDDKKRRLDKANIDYSNVEFVSANFVENEWKNALLKLNFDSNKKTFCSMLGISYYLTREEFENFMKNVSNLLKEGSEIVLDYPNDFETENEKINQKLAKCANEEMKSMYSFKDIENICDKNNLLIYENLTSKDMNNSYFYDYNTLNPTNRIIAPKGVSYCLIVKK